MELDFGCANEYNPDGFSFVEGFFDRRLTRNKKKGAFLHIKKIKDNDVQNALKNNENVFFWYSIEKTNKGDSVETVYRNVRKIPEEILYPFLDKLSERHLNGHFACTGKGERLMKEPSFYSQLFTDTRIPDNKLDKILKVFIKVFILEHNYRRFINPQEDFSFIRETQKNTVKLMLESDWKKRSDLAKCTEEVTKELQLFELTRQFGDEQYEALYSTRLFYYLKNNNIIINDRIKELTIKTLGEEQYNALISEREDTLKEEQEALNEYLVKFWKDKKSLLNDRINALTLKTLGEEQYNLLLSERLSVKRNSRFIVQDGIATDNYTGLTWCRYTLRDGISPKGFKEEEVIQAVEKFNESGGEAGFTDWRLPTIFELSVLTNLRQLELIESGIEPGDKTKWAYLDKTVFPDAAVYYPDRHSPLNSNYYAPRVWGNSGAVYYYDSDWYTGDRRSRTNSIRLVRGEPLFDMYKANGYLGFNNLEDWQWRAQNNEEIAKIKLLN